MNRIVGIRVLIVAALVVAIEAVCRLGWVKPGTLVPPTVMVQELLRLMQGREFWVDVATSSRSIVVAFVAAMGVGCLAAVLLHALPRLRAAVEPLISSYYALPFFVLYPLLIVLLGMNQLPIIAIGFLYAVMAATLGTLSGLDRIPNVLLKTARVCHLTHWQQAVYVSLPAAAPYVFTGAKLALGYAITGVLGSEFILATSGYGYSIAFAYNNFEDRRMYALLLFLLVGVGVLHIVLYRVQRSVQHRSSSGVGADKSTASASWERLLAGAITVVALGVAWQLVHLSVSTEALAAPTTTLVHLVELLGTRQFWGHIAETATALGLALLISCLAGTVFGVLLGMNTTATEVSEPMLVTLYSLPKVTLYPVVLLMVGIGLAAKVVFGAMYGMIPMIILTMNAIRSMNPSLRRTARVMRLSRVQTVASVLLPATLPEIVTGLRVSFSITLLGVMIGEMFASTRGLGFVIMNSMNVNDTATMMAVTVLVATLAVAINVGLIALDRAVHRK